MAVVLRAVSDLKNSELAKLKIQEILFQPQFGMLGIPIQQNETNLQFQSTPISSFVPRPSLPQTSHSFEREDTTSTEADY